jgi:hypothetical protein
LEPLDQNPKEEKPRIWSRTVVTVFFLLNPFFGGIMLLQNLKSIGEKTAGIYAFGFGILWTAVLIIFPIVVHQYNWITSVLLDVAGSLMIVSPYFRQYFSSKEKFHYRKVWVPLLIIACIVFILILLILLNALDWIKN